MTSATTLFNLSEIAFAVYADLEIGSMASSLNISRLQQIGFTAKQAAEFAERYTTAIVPTYHDTFFRP